jgi:hypothetical protein
MSKIIVNAELTIDKEAAQNMLSCAGYGSEERSDDKLVKDLLSILDCYGVTSTVTTPIKSPEEEMK